MAASPLLRRYLSKRQATSAIYFAMFFVTLHYAVRVYVEAGYLKQFIAEEELGIVYTIASLISIFVLARAPSYFRLYGQYAVTATLMSLSIISLIVLAYATSPIIVLPLFILVYTISISLRYVLDIYLEEFSSDKETGLLRGLFLTVMNVAFVFAPLMAGRFIFENGDGSDNFSLVFLASAAFMTLSFLVARKKLSRIKELKFRQTKFWTSIQIAWQRKAVWHGLITQFLLQFFYAIVVIYLPIYLHDYLHFSWKEVGLMTTIALFSFIILQVPLGWFADKYLGEKELLVLSFIILAGANTWITFSGATSVIVWAAILFVGRTGSAILEIMSETYYFKQVTERDTGLISLFRNIQPLGYIVTPILATMFLSYFDLPLLFAATGIVMASGIYFSLRLKDTR